MTDPLDNLKRRIATARGDRPVQGAETHPPSSDMRAGLRVVGDLSAAVIVGGLIGWFLDGWLGTSPWGLVVMLLIGAAAGLNNIFRYATGHGAAVGYASQDQTVQTGQPEDSSTEGAQTGRRGVTKD